jgi:hypothetical protein
MTGSPSNTQASTPSQSQTPLAAPGYPCTSSTLCASGLCAPTNRVCCTTGVTANFVSECVPVTRDRSRAGYVSDCDAGYFPNQGSNACGRPAGFGCTADADCFSSTCRSSYCCASPIGNCNSCEGGTGECKGCSGGLVLNERSTLCIAAPASSSGSSSDAKKDSNSTTIIGGAVGGVIGILLCIAPIIARAISTSIQARAVLCCFCRMRYHSKLATAQIQHPLASALYIAFLLPEPGFRGDVSDADRALIAVERAIFAALGITLPLRPGNTLDDDAVQKLARRAVKLFTVDASGEYRLPPRRFCWLLGPSSSSMTAKLGAPGDQ